MNYGTSVSIPQIVSQVEAAIVSQTNGRDIFIADSGTIASNMFICSAIPIAGSEVVTWNGLIQSPAYYQIVGTSLIFDNDISLAVGDEIIVTYLT